jgi:hypothetical protein
MSTHLLAFVLLTQHRQVVRLSHLTINSIRVEVYFCHQNQNAKNIGNFTTLLKPHNIGTNLKGIETSFQVIPLFLKSSHFWLSYITF